MAIDWIMSGGGFTAQTANSPGIWLSTNGSVTVTSSAPSGRASTYAFKNNAAFGGSFLTTPVLGSFSTIYAGQAFYVTGLNNGVELIAFQSSTGTAHCELRYNASGQVYFTQNNGTIGTLGPAVILPNTWIYVEFKAILSTTSTGTCEVRINGSVVSTQTGLTNASSGAQAGRVIFSAGDGSYTGYSRDMYVVDSASGTYTSYLGDINVLEVYPNGAGVNSAWSPAQAGSSLSLPFSITSVANASGGTTVYTGTITGGASNAYVGYTMVTSGFAHSVNNGTFICTASSGTNITLNNASGLSDTTGSMTFQCIPQIGINGTGTRPNGDALYLADSTTNDISDFAHTNITLTGTMEGISHISYLRKDDAGSRSVAQVCLSSGTTNVAATQSLGNTYQYYISIYETDPHTSSPWTANGFNLATFGVKEIT